MLFRIFWAGQTIFSKGILTILINKLISSTFGPQGLATFGYWQNFLTLSNGLSNGSAHNGIILLASRHNDSKGRAQLLKECAYNSLLFTIVTVVILVLALMHLDFPIDSHEKEIIPYIAPLVPIVSLSLNFSNFASGLKQHVIVGISQLVSSLTILAGCYIAWKANALVVAIIFLSLAFVPQLLILIWHFRHDIKAALRVERATNFSKELRHYGFATLIMLASFPLANYIIRGQFLTHSSGIEAGIWEASLRLAGIVTALMSFLNATYFLPSFRPGDATHNRSLLLRYNGIQGVILLALAIAPQIPGLQISTLLFSDKFSALEALLPQIALMEFVRGNQYFMTNVVIANKRLKYLVCMELFFSLSLWIVVLLNFIPLTTQTVLSWYTCLYALSGMTHGLYLRKRRDL